LRGYRLHFGTARRRSTRIAAALAGAGCDGRVVTTTPVEDSLAFTYTPKKFGAGVADLHIIETERGHGAEAVPGKFVVVRYTGWLYDASAADGRGRQFDSTAARNAAFGFYLGTRKVIAGGEEGIPGMRVGGQRTLVVPPGMAYGPGGGAGGIPPNAALVFDIELVDVRDRQPGAR
jgi:hypothetical protein